MNGEVESQLNDVRTNPILLRGIVLDGVIDIERKIDDYLSTYFCNSLLTKNELNELLFFSEKLTPDMKRQIFVALLIRHNSDFITDYPSFLPFLERVIPHKHTFSHLQLDADQSSKKEGLAFKKFSNGKLRLQEYTGNEITELRTQMQLCDLCLDLLLKELLVLT